MPYYLDLNGNNAWAAFPAFIDVTKRLLIGAWIKTTSTAPMNIITIGAVKGGKFIKEFQLSISNNTLRCEVMNTVSCVSANTTSVCDGKWHFVGVAFGFPSVAMYFIKDDTADLASTSALPASQASDPLPISNLMGDDPQGVNRVLVGASPDFGITFTGAMSNVLIKNIPGQTSASAEDTLAAVRGVYKSVISGPDLRDGNNPWWVYCPLFGTLGADQLRNLAISSSSGKTISQVGLKYTPDTFLDGYAELCYNAPSGSFPVFSQDEEAAFAHIMAAIKVEAKSPADFRAFYGNEVQPLGIYYSDISELKYSNNSAYTPQVFASVQSQLKDELKAATALQSYYTKASTFYDGMYADLTAQLDNVSRNISGINQQAQVSGDLSDVIELATSAIELVEGLEVVATLIKGIWAASNLGEDGRDGDDHGGFSAQYDSLATALNRNWQAALATVSGQVSAMLKDWGKLSVVVELLSKNQLSWQISYDSNSMSKMQPAYQKYFAQILMTAMFQRFNFIAESNLQVASVGYIGHPAVIPDPFIIRATQAGNGDSVIGQGNAGGISAVPSQDTATFLFTTLGITSDTFWGQWPWQVVNVECPFSDSVAPLQLLGGVG